MGRGAVVRLARLVHGYRGSIPHPMNQSVTHVVILAAGQGTRMKSQLPKVLHPVAGLRSYGDLDILVAPTDLREAGERLLGAGWQVLATPDDLRNGEVTGELEIGRAGSVVVDLHWSLGSSAPGPRA